MERDPSNNVIVTTDAEQALLREQVGSDVRRGEQHLAIARRALLEGRLAAGERHLIKAAQACEEDRPGAAHALWEVIDDYDPTRQVFREQQQVFGDAPVDGLVDAVDTIAREHDLVVPLLGATGASQPQRLDEARMHLVRAREAFAHDELAQAEQAMDSAIGWLHMNGLRSELVAELDAFIEDFDPGRVLDLLVVGSSLDADPGERQTDLLLAGLDDIAARHGLDIATRHSTGFVEAADVSPELLLELRMQRMQVGEQITLANGTTVAQHERGYVVDATLVGPDADIGANIAVERDSARADQAAVSAAGAAGVLPEEIDARSARADAPAQPDRPQAPAARGPTALERARDARGVAALCQARSAQAAIAGGRPAVASGASPLRLERPADRGAGR